MKIFKVFGKLWASAWLGVWTTFGITMESFFNGCDYNYLFILYILDFVIMDTF
jgi:hypothetical protein